MSSDDDDLERGLGFRLHEGGRRQPEHKHTNNPAGPQSARAGVFRIHTAVAGFRRLVNTIGTPNDNLHLRQRLQSTRVQIGQLVKETSAKLKPVADNYDQNHPVLKTYFQLQPPVEEIANAKLAKDVQSVLREFEKAHHHLLTAEKDTIILSPNNNNNVGQTSSFMESMRQEAIIQLENEIDLHDESMSMFEEREEAGMKEIQEQINEVNEIFRDIADHLELVHEQQGITIEGIVPNTEISNTAITAQATSELPKASRNHSSESSMTCLSLVIFVVILLIVLILLAA